MKILIIGASGMIGHYLFGYLSQKKKYQIYGFVRNKRVLKDNKFLFNHKNILEVEILRNNNLKKIILDLQPEIIINCSGIVKQNPLIRNVPLSIELNSIFPHNLNIICKELDCRLIQLSTDCVFSGIKGNYKETDLPDPNDIYGRSKLLGELDYKNCITIRTSFIGHELVNNWGLLSWFLSQKNKVKGFKNAIYSGLTTLEISKVIKNFVITNNSLNGLYHISSNPIDKFSLLRIINQTYGKNLNIEPDYLSKSDKSLNSLKFQNETGYKPIEWEDAIRELKNYQDLNYV